MDADAERPAPIKSQVYMTVDVPAPQFPGQPLVTPAEGFYVAGWAADVNGRPPEIVVSRWDEQAGRFVRIDAVVTQGIARPDVAAWIASIPRAVVTNNAGFHAYAREPLLPGVHALCVQAYAEGGLEDEQRGLVASGTATAYLYPILTTRGVSAPGFMVD